MPQSVSPRSAHSTGRDPGKEGGMPTKLQHLVRSYAEHVDTCSNKMLKTNPTMVAWQQMLALGDWASGQEQTRPLPQAAKALKQSWLWLPHWSRPLSTQRAPRPADRERTRLLTRLLQQVSFPSPASAKMSTSLFASLFEGQREV
jgi:hypothetical protein